MHSERLEFLGDVVVELIVTVHLFFLLPDHDEGEFSIENHVLVNDWRNHRVGKGVFG